ncbi:MAG: hypothetical protein HOP20_02750 [Sulfuriferula sp.]|nr:hypothetical protein [Sulfuriferula sp.]
MADNQFEKKSSSGGVKWLLVGGMLIALAVWVYKSDDAQRYGETALAKTQGAGTWLGNLGDKARHAYQCATSDTPPAPAQTASVAATPCCPACPPCATTPPYMDFGRTYGANPAQDNSAAQTPAAPPVASEAVAPTPAPANYPAYPVMPQANTSASVPPAPVQPATVASVVKPLTAAVVSKDMLRARNWVAQKKYDFAIVAYKKHIAAYPEDVNGYGEIGNVYLLAKHYPQAAQSFYEAANRLLDAGYVDEVQPMLPVITQYQPQLAAQLKSKITLMGK